MDSNPTLESLDAITSSDAIAKPETIVKPEVIASSPAMTEPESDSVGPKDELTSPSPDPKSDLVYGPSKDDMVFLAQQTMRVVDILTMPYVYISHLRVPSVLSVDSKALLRTDRLSAKTQLAFKNRTQKFYMNQLLTFGRSCLASVTEMTHELLALLESPDNSVFRRAIIELLVAEVSPAASADDPLVGEKTIFAPETHGATALKLLKELKERGISTEDESAITLVEKRAIEVSGFWKRGAWENFLKDRESQEKYKKMCEDLGTTDEIGYGRTLWKKLLKKIRDKVKHWNS